jgi:hypothetical protein
VFRVYLLFLFVGLCYSSSTEALERLYESWGTSPLQQKLRHPSEGAVIEGKKLIVKTRFENYSVLQQQIADRNLSCRFLHSFIYGRHRLRSSPTKLLPQMAFDRFKQIDQIEFQFFTSILYNEPTSPYWDKRPNLPPSAPDASAQLRVLWNRNEVIVPYLQLEITRQEWMTLAGLLESRPLYGFSEFNQEACDSVFRLVPQLRTNFQAVRNALNQKK